MDFKSRRFPSLMSAIRLNIPMAPTTTTKSLSLFFFLLLSHALLAAKAQQRQIDGCASFSCGQFQNISFPFSRRDGPPDCSETFFQLNCQGNKSTFSIGSVEYPVTKIQQLDYYSSDLVPVYTGFIRLVDPNFVGGGSCGLPAQSLSPDILRNMGFWRDFERWASFMNCTEPIKDSGYWPVSCVNSSYTSSLVYIFIARKGYELQYLHPSCQFISMIPVADYDCPENILNSTADAFNILQQGFNISFSFDESVWLPKLSLLNCLGAYKRMIYDLLHSKNDFGSSDYQQPFFCLQQYFYHQVASTRRTAVVTIKIALVVTFIQIVGYLTVHLILIRLIVAPFAIWFFVAYKLWSTKRQEAIDIVEKFLRRQQTLMPTRYAYTDIIAITRHFKEKLGQGGFGLVFKGELAGGILVAVKMMGNSKCNGDEFINEVSTIGRIHHINVVRLVGYCSEGSKRALVYEYMPNGSLDKYIFSNRNGTNLYTFTSEKLIDIAMGVAQGINYLHRGCDMQILHFDIKPHNILLDHNFTPKISDFGLARLYPKDNSLVSISATRGTIGYIAPELISRSFGVISQKSDVYSYGMLLMEMAGRRRNVDPLIGNSSQVYYPSWIYDKLNQQQEIILENNFEISELEKKLAIVGLWCIQMKSFERPIMTKVIEMLESDVETIPMPPKPFLSSMESISKNRMCLGLTSTELSVVSE